MSITSDIFNPRLPTLFNQSITMLTQVADPVGMAIVTSEDVVRPSELSNNWQIRKLVMGNVTGVVENDPSSLGGNTSRVIYGDNVIGPVGDRLYWHNTPSTVGPDPSDSPGQSVGQITIGLIGFRASLPMVLAQMQAEALPAFVGKIFAPLLRGFAQNIVRTRLAQFYADDSNGALATVASIVTAAAVSGGTGTITVTISEGVESRFIQGMSIDGYVGAVRRNQTGAGERRQWVVGAVDRALRRMVIVDKSGSAGAGNGGLDLLAVGDKFYTRNSYGNGLPNFNTWFLGQGTYYGLSLANFPEYKSLLRTETGPMTDAKLALIFDAYDRMQFDNDHALDTVLINPSTTTAYINNKIPLWQINQTQGSPINVMGEGRKRGFAYHHGGRMYVFRETWNMPRGKMYGLKVGGGNLKRYVPPKVGNANGIEGIPEFMEFEFVLPSLGHNSIWDIKRGPDGLATNMMYTAGISRFNIVPENPSGIKVNGFAYEEITGEAT